MTRQADAIAEFGRQLNDDINEIRAEAVEPGKTLKTDAGTAASW